MTITRNWKFNESGVTPRDAPTYNSSKSTYELHSGCSLARANEGMSGFHYNLSYDAPTQKHHLLIMLDDLDNNRHVLYNGPFPPEQEDLVRCYGEMVAKILTKSEDNPCDPASVMPWLEKKTQP